MSSPTIIPQLEHANSALSTYFAVFHFVGGIGNLLLLIIVGLNRNVSRHPTWYGFCFSWVPYTMSYVLLILTGHQSEPQPRPWVCFTQAALVYASTTLAGAAVFSFVLHLWFDLTSMLHDPTSKEAQLRTTGLLMFPYVVAFPILLIAMAVGAEHPDTVHRNSTHLYCIIGDKLPERVVSLVFIVVMTIIVVLEVYIAIVLYRRWEQFWGLKSRFTHNFLAIIIRVAIFTVFGVMSVIVCLIILAKSATPIPSVFLALLPVVSFLIMGTQVDIIRICIFWKTFPDAKQTSSSVEEDDTDVILIVRDPAIV